MACCLAGAIFLLGQHLLVTCSVAPCSSSHSTMVISIKTVPETHVLAGNSQVLHQLYYLLS